MQCLPCKLARTLIPKVATQGRPPPQALAESSAICAGRPVPLRIAQPCGIQRLELLLVCRQFMVGDALLVTPVMEEGASQVLGYFPPAMWYSMWDKHEAIDARCGATLAFLSTRHRDVQKWEGRAFGFATQKGARCSACHCYLASALGCACIAL
jgi:hypothetical protein